MKRPFGGAGYLWMTARAKNASRRYAVMGIVGGLVFIGALIAFVLVPRQATRAAVRVTNKKPVTQSVPEKQVVGEPEGFRGRHVHNHCTAGFVPARYCSFCAQIPVCA